MGELVIRPDTTISAGNWSVTDANIPDTLNDQSDITLTNNTTQVVFLTKKIDELVKEVNILKNS
jgi:hypothetical protein